MPSFGDGATCDALEASFDLAAVQFLEHGFSVWNNGNFPMDSLDSLDSLFGFIGFIGFSFWIHWILFLNESIILGTFFSFPNDDC